MVSTILRQNALPRKYSPWLGARWSTCLPWTTALMYKINVSRYGIQLLLNIIFIYVYHSSHWGRIRLFSSTFIPNGLAKTGEVFFAWTWAVTAVETGGNWHAKQSCFSRLTLVALEVFTNHLWYKKANIAIFSAVSLEMSRLYQPYWNKVLVISNFTLLKHLVQIKNIGNLWPYKVGININIAS